MTVSEAGRLEGPKSDVVLSAAEALRAFAERMVSAFAVTQGARHELVYANAEFLRMIPTAEFAVGRPIAEAFFEPTSSELRTVLDGVIRSGAIAQGSRIAAPDSESATWHVTAWPAKQSGGDSSHLVIELRRPTPGELATELQRDVAEQMLLGALRQQDAAERAEAFGKRSTFLAVESGRLSRSLDEEATLRTIAGLTLPRLGAWCIVDLLNDDATMHRLPIVHPDPSKQAVVSGLADSWPPQPGDAFGIPVASRNEGPDIVTNGVDVALAASTHDRPTLDVLNGLEIAALLTVPLIVRDLLVGAITFVAPKGGRFTEQDVALAQELAARSAVALDSSRLYRAAIARQIQAEAESNAKSEFLGTMSHELRTPLAAIVGYLDIMDMGLHGPVTGEQRSDLSRMRHSLEHLVRLIGDILTIVRIGKHQLHIDNADVRVVNLLTVAVELVEPLILEKHLRHDVTLCDPTVVINTDREKVMQILVNLLSNAIKFTPAGGQVAVNCEASEQAVFIRISDNGVGIPSDKLDAIFEPFVQVANGVTHRAAGLGLGLAISRNLARAMNGDLTVESALNIGSRFTLVLPRVDAAAAVAR